MDFERVNSFLESFAVDDCGELNEIYKDAENRGVPVIRRNTKELLRLLILIAAPKRILEVGTAVGYSALFMDDVMKRAEDVFCGEMPDTGCGDTQSDSDIGCCFGDGMDVGGGCCDKHVSGDGGHCDTQSAGCGSDCDTQSAGCGSDCDTMNSDCGRCDTMTDGDIGCCDIHGAGDIGHCDTMTDGGIGNSNTQSVGCGGNGDIHGAGDVGHCESSIREIVTIELDEARADEAEANFDRCLGNGRNIRLLRGDAYEVMKEMTVDEYGLFDMVFIDAAKAQYGNYLEEAMRLTHKGSIIICDNILAGGEILESHFLVDKRDRTIHDRMRNFLKNLKSDARLDTALLSVGDGMSVSVRLSE